MEDSDIIQLYWDRSERAIAETSGKYGSFLWRIAWNILKSHGDAEECVNDTYLRTWNAIPPRQAQCLSGLAGAHHPEPEPGPLEPGAGPEAGRR